MVLPAVPLCTTTVSPSEMVTLVSTSPLAATPKLPTMPSSAPLVLALTSTLPPLAVVMSIAPPVPVDCPTRPWELSPFTVTEVAPMSMVTVPVPVPAAKTP